MVAIRRERPTRLSTTTALSQPEGEHVSATMSPAEILAALVGFDTTSHKSNLDLIAWVEAYLAQLGVPAERIYDASGQKANLWATIGPADRSGYILSGHTDVVPVEGQDWSSDPFTLTARDGRLYGRGSCDMKGFLACCLAQVPAMLAARLAKPLHLAFSYDEEVGCLGVRGLIAQLAAAPVRPEACFVGEPTSMQVVVAHKAKRSFDVEITGRSCHSSLAPEGVNAVDYAAMLALEIRRMGEAFVAEGPSDPLFTVPVSTAHTGVLQGGTALNIVPDRAFLVFEFRMLPAASLDVPEAQIRAYARDVLEPAMRRVAPEAGIAIHARSDFPGLDTATDAPVVQLARRLARRNDHGKVAYGTEAGLFAAIDIPTVVIGPGDIAQAHRPDEFVEVAELERCTAFLDRLIAHASQR
jgi:acetylornithine deacetylase